MQAVTGILAITSIALTTVAVYVPLTWWLVKLLWVRDDALRRHRHRMDKIILWWTGSNRRMYRTLSLSDVQVIWHQQEEMSDQNWYLVICNHQSWTDIVMLQSHLYGTIPPLKFFTKEQLIWIPFIGLAMKVLGFPYVKRVTKAQIKSNPELRNADRKNVTEACDGFKNHPTSILNFVEGTRRTAEKHQRQRSEFEHLLRPKIGGLGYVIEDMGSHLHKLLDVTIIYPDGVPTFWGFLQGKCPRIIIEVTPHDIPERLMETEDASHRTELAQWIKNLWQQKDARIGETLSSDGASNV